ncbi:MAG TPA: ATP-binding protein [Anaerolineae bacterium]
MSLLQQVIQLLSESPGNIVFHLVTLFALQAVLAISLSQWRRDPDDRQAQRLAWAAGALVLARAILLVVGLWLNSEPGQAIAILPPLEQTLNTATAVLLVWALAPHSARFPRLGDVLLLIALLIIGVMAFSFIQSWQVVAAAGDSYNSSGQATVWALVQIIVLAAGVALTLSDRRRRASLHPLVLGVLLLAHLAHFWNYPEIVTTDTNIAYWIRLGHLVAFPLLAVLAYRQSLAPLLAARPAERPSPAQLRQSLQLSTQLIGSLDQEQTLLEAIRMAGAVIDVAFVGIGLLDEDDGQQLYLASNQPQAGMDQPRSWQLRLVDWPPLQQAIEQRQSLELVPGSSGARQLHRLYEYLEVGPRGALLIEPLTPIPGTNSMPMGLLLLGKSESRPPWSNREKALAPVLAGYLAQALLNARRHANALHQPTIVPPSPPPAAVSGRIVALEEERDQLLANLETANSRLLQSEARAATAMKRAQDLAATIEEMERVGVGERVAALETEIETLRESLIEAEEAMALASAGEGGLSTDWVMMTITRYSGQLEEAQARIETLETELARRERGPLDEVLISLVQELRTPMTSIAGYTALLLGETMGILGVRQRELLQRVQANTERMGGLLDQIVQLTTGQEQPARPDETKFVDVREVIETAVSAVITQIREKRLNLVLDIADDLPPLAVSRNALHQIITNLLGNACQSSASDGRIGISAYAGSLAAGRNGDGERINFIHLAVSDSGGGITVEDRPRVFDAQHRADSPLIAGVGDTGAGLAVARSLTLANGGRIWVDSELGVGSTFSVLFPISTPETDGEPSTVANGRLVTGGPDNGGA